MHEWMQTCDRPSDRQTDGVTDRTRSREASASKNNCPRVQDCSGFYLQYVLSWDPRLGRNLDVSKKFNPARFISITWGMIS